MRLTWLRRNRFAAVDGGGEIAALRQLLERIELNGLLVQAEALQANALFL